MIMNVKKIKGFPKFDSDRITGYVLWKQSDGFHLRWTPKGKKTQNFRGTIFFDDKVRITNWINPETENFVIITEKNSIEWNLMFKGQLDGFDFLTPGDITLDLRIKKKKVKPKEIFLGPDMLNPENNPFTITQIAPIEEEIVEPELVVDPDLELEHIAEPEPEPVVEPEPVAEPEPEPVAEPEPDAVAELELEPTTAQAVQEDDTARITAWFLQALSRQASKPAEEEREVAPEPEPIVEPEPEPIAEPEPVIEPEPEPVAESEPEPIMEPAPVMVLEPEPIVEPKPATVQATQEDDTARITAWFLQVLSRQAPISTVETGETTEELEQKSDLLIETEPKPIDEPETLVEIEKHVEKKPEFEAEKIIEEIKEDELTTRVTHWFLQLKSRFEPK